MPLRLLVTEPVVFWFSLWVSFAWAVLYMQFSSIGIVFRSVYGFDSAQVGAVYFNFTLWAVAIYPAWLVLKHFGKDNESVVEHHEGGTVIEAGVIRWVTWRGSSRAYPAPHPERKCERFGCVFFVRIRIRI